MAATTVKSHRLSTRCGDAWRVQRLAPVGRHEAAISPSEPARSEAAAHAPLAVEPARDRNHRHGDDGTATYDGTWKRPAGRDAGELGTVVPNCDHVAMQSRGAVSRRLSSRDQAASPRPSPRRRGRSFLDDGQHRRDDHQQPDEAVAVARAMTDQVVMRGVVAGVRAIRPGPTMLSTMSRRLRPMRPTRRRPTARGTAPSRPPQWKILAGASSSEREAQVDGVVHGDDAVDLASSSRRGGRAGCTWRSAR